MIGQKLLHYEIVEKLGEGGMGVVYKARDTHLDRFVAIKVLTPDKVADQQRKARFVQEAKAASALNHPNIVHIYDISTDAGVDFIAMEYIAGKALDQIIPRRGMRLNEALKIAVQIADAMSRAHDSGIVHRDLKPPNLMVDEHGVVKVLDFGTAKLTEAEETTPDSVTRTLAVKTSEGAVVGTVAYMSPEQAEGRKLDARSDIFSFGSVLYEMVTGRRAFSADTAAGTQAAVIKDQPKPASEVAPDVPRELEKLISRCLEKSLDRRWQHMADLKVALRELREESDTRTGRAAVSRAKRMVLWLWAALAVLLLTTGGGWLLWLYGRRVVAPPSVVQLTSASGTEAHPSFSPDGNQVAFAWNGDKGDNFDIYVKLVGEPNVLRLTSDPAQDLRPAWSPDGKRIAFQRFLANGSSSVYLISPLGGAEQRLADIPVRGQMSWSPDGKWLAVARGPGNASELVLLPADGGEPRQITSRKPPAFHWQPVFSPDGRRLAYAGCTGVWSCDPYVQEMAPDCTPRGGPVRVTAVQRSISGIAWTTDGDSIIYSAEASETLPANLWRVDAKGSHPPERIELAGPRAAQPVMSPTGNRLAFLRSLRDCDIWSYQPGSAHGPLIRSSLWDANPQFSPDGKKVAFESSRTGEANEVWVANSDGSNPVQLTKRLSRHQGTPKWSPDGRWIAFDSLGEEGRFNIYVVEASGGRPRRLTSEESSGWGPGWSRDGRWIYFTTSRTAGDEIWRAPSVGGPAEQVTPNGGQGACESVDGKMLFYTKGSESPLFAVPLAGGPETQIVDAVVFRAFVVVDDGVYYIGQHGEDGLFPLAFYQFSTKRSHEIARLEAVVGYGLGVSPNRRAFLYTKGVASGADLMLIENFR